MMHERTSEAHGHFFKVLAKYEGQKPILFGRLESKPMIRESSEDGFESL